MSFNMNQSIFGLIAAAGSRVDFNNRFDASSSDEEDDGNQSKSSGQRHRDMSQTAVLPPSTKDRRQGHKKRLSSHRLLKSFATLPKLKSKSHRESSRLSEPVKGTDDASETSDLSSPAGPSDGTEDLRLAPVMSRMLQAKAEMTSRPSFDMERRSADLRRSDDADSDDASPLAKRLMEIFEFDEPEQVIEGSSCPLPPVA